MKSFQEKDAFHLKTLLTKFSSFHAYHIEVFQKEYKKIFYASNNEKWHQHYIENKLWESDTLINVNEHSFDEDVMEWPSHYFEERKSLNLSQGFLKKKIDMNFMRIIKVACFDQNIDELPYIFDQLETILETQ